MPVARAVVPTAAAAPAGPQILSIAVTPQIVHSGEAVSWNVRTTLDVTRVTAHVSAYSFDFERRGAGVFGLNFTVPANVPVVFHGAYALDVVARNAAGASVTRTVSVTFE